MHETADASTTHLENVSLVVSAHRSSSYADYQGREGVETTPVAGGFRDCIVISAGSFQGCDGYRCKPTSQATRFEPHPDHTRKPEHDSDTYMLNFLGGIRVTRVRAKAFHPCVCYPVQEDHKRLDKFRGDVLANGSTIPCPAKFGE